LIGELGERCNFWTRQEGAPLTISQSAVHPFPQLQDGISIHRRLLSQMHLGGRRHFVSGGH
jgi:hypothetical protein